MDNDSTIPKVPIRDVFIGKVDVNDEIRLKNFIELYYDKDSISETITRDSIFLVTGRKGTGKSYFANYLLKISEQNDKLFCKVCDQDTYNREKISKIKSASVGKDQSTLLWKWIIYSQFTEMIIEKRKFKKYIPFTTTHKLYKVYKKINKRLDVIYKPKGKVIANASKYGGIINSPDKIMGISGENQSQSSTQYDVVEYYENIPLLEELLINSLKHEKGFLLIFDDLDELDGATNKSIEYNNSILGLIKTVKELNAKIYDYEHKAIIMLRSDIIRSLMLHSANLNKHTAECNITLNWFEDKNKINPSEHPLIIMVLKKVKATVPEYSNYSYEELYKHLFPEKVNNKDPFSFLLDHSFGRPRDLVAYLNKVKDIEKDSEVHYFSAKSIRKAKKKYARWFLQELYNEISIHDNKMFVEESVRLVRNHKKITFSLNDISDFYELNKADYPNIQDIKEALTELYKYGVVGNQNNSKSYWGYREDADSEPNFSLDFTIHYAIQPTL